MGADLVAEYRKGWVKPLGLQDIWELESPGKQSGIKSGGSSASLGGV
jgi:hypothetical protein